MARPYRSPGARGASVGGALLMGAVVLVIIGKEWFERRSMATEMKQKAVAGCVQILGSDPTCRAAIRANHEDCWFATGQAVEPKLDVYTRCVSLGLEKYRAERRAAPR